jgi:hypothetical protein
VARRALARRAFEYGVGVARLARQIAVLPEEFEARGEVIE